jgi:hypothetical protein
LVTPLELTGHGSVDKFFLHCLPRVFESEEASDSIEEPKRVEIVLSHE